MRSFTSGAFLGVNIRALDGCEYFFYFCWWPLTWAWIYALVSAGEAALEDLALRHAYPMAVDLACVDPEAAEPCNRHFKLLADVFAKQGCVEVMELLCALEGPVKSKEAIAVQDGRSKLAASSREEVVKEAFLWYLRSRVKAQTAGNGGKEASMAELRNLMSQH
ncbi:unnamed protein product [Symbiodinium natans]|uniref:Uncharacterized protein n=1 Tax=Symbiodinium natans TaxID=878477 RepID=A0A812T974_9DINO|nr:unnamed protein product [Symbiodinium natans]